VCPESALVGGAVLVVFVCEVLVCEVFVCAVFVCGVFICEAFICGQLVGKAFICELFVSELFVCAHRACEAFACEPFVSEVLVCDVFIWGAAVGGTTPPFMPVAQQGVVRSSRASSNNVVAGRLRVRTWLGVPEMTRVHSCRSMRVSSLVPHR